MAFKPKGTENANFTRLQSILVQTKQQTENNPLYQVIKGLIDVCRQEQISVKDSIGNVVDDVNAVIGPGGDLANATFITVNDETGNFPNSRQLVAGTGITIDTSVAGQITISASSGIWAPLTDGDLDEAELIFADGACIMVELV